METGEESPKPVEYVHLRNRRDNHSGASHIITGIVCLLVYSCFLEQLWYYSTCSSGNLAVYSHVVYGLMSNVGHFVGIFVNGSLPTASRIYVSCALMCAAAFAYPSIAAAKIGGKLMWSLIATAGLAVGNSLCVSTAAGIAASTSAGALNYLYMGQSISGLIPWPLMMVTNIGLQLAGVEQFGIPSRIDVLGSSIVMCICGTVTLLFVPFFQLVLLPGIKSRKSVAVISVFGPDRFVIIFKRMLPLTVSVWCVLVVSFIVYPREIIKWKPMISDMTEFPFLAHPATYTSTMVFVVIVADVIGIWCSKFFAFLSDNASRVLAGLRLVFVPLFWLASNHVWFASLWFRLTISFCMGLSGGLLFAVLLAHLGRFVGGSSNMESGGHIITFTVVNGIAVGAILGAAMEVIPA